MKAAADHRLSLLVSFVILALSAPQARQQPAAPSSLETRAEREAFLSKATVSTDTPADGRRSWRASLASDTRKHDALVQTADGSDPTRQDYRFNVAAYELDKLLRLDLVLPTVERFVGGRPAALTWWLDGVAMNELDRRRKAIDIPDMDSWRRQMDAVRIFDELISNTYRNTSPGLYLNTVWDNLLITSDWTIWLTDHTAAFRNRQGLEDPESLRRCPRTVLTRLRELNRAQFQQTIGKYLSPQQLDALETRRALLVGHFNDQIAGNGEAVVLYDLRPRP